MKKYTVVALSLAVLLMTSGCSKDDSSSSSGGSNDTNTGGDTSKKTKYEGSWAASDGFDVTINGTTLKVGVDITEHNATTQVRGTGYFSIDGTKKVQPNDITVDKVTHIIETCIATQTPLTTLVVASLNANNTCGGGWTVNVSKNISDCTLPGESTTVCTDVKETAKTIFS